MMLCGKFLGNTTQSLYGVALTISCLSFGRFYTIYTITAPNTAATAYVRQCKTGNPLFYCRYSACHLLIPPSNFPKMIRIHIAGNALPRWLNHSCFPPSASFCPWSGHEKAPRVRCFLSYSVLRLKMCGILRSFLVHVQTVSLFQLCFFSFLRLLAF